MLNFVIPQTFFLGPLVIHYYGITMALAVLAGYFLAARRAGKFDYSRADLDKLFIWLLVAGFTGARAYHILSDWRYYFNYPLEILQIWHGGLSVFGAIIGGFIALWIICQRHPLPSLAKGAFGRLLDWLSPSLLLGQIIGRFGNLFNYELIGEPTNLPWGMYVPEIFRPQSFENIAYFHPFPIYEQVLNLGWILSLLYLEKKLNLKEHPGKIFALYLIGYGVIRFFLEWVRLETVKFFGVVPVNAVISLVLVTIGVIVFKKSIKSQKGRDYPLPFGI